MVLFIECFTHDWHRLFHVPPHVGYYDGATELYEYGWAQSFHFSRFYKGEAFAASLARHEHYLAAQMSLRPGMRVLDVGCGVGGPAREIARFSDAKIVGLNNNEFQIGRARRYTKAAGLEDQVQFVKGDFMKLSEQFGENAFDAGASSFLSQAIYRA
jgi:sterol 24-C-methyltransferase